MIMATNAADRAARRSSIQNARRTAAATEVPEAIADVVNAAPEPAPEPSPEPVAPSRPRSRVQTAAPTPEAPSEPAQGPSAAPIQMPARRQAPAGGAMALPMRDLSRELTSRDMVIPKLKLAQGLSQVSKLFAMTRGKEGIPAGVWYHTTSNRDLGETVYFIPCDMRKSRSLFQQGTGVMCRSFDLLHGEGDPGTLCEGSPDEMYLPENERGCPMRLWTRTEKGNLPPPCGETYNYTGFIVMDPENPGQTEILQAMLQMRSTHVQAAKQLNTAVVTMGAGEWTNCLIELKSEARSNTKGDFFVPGVDLYDLLDGPEWARVKRRAVAFARQMGASDLRASIEHDPDAE